MNKSRIIGFIPVMLGMLILNYFDIFPLFVFIPIFVLGSCIELVKVLRGEFKSLIPILYDLGTIGCITTAAYFFKSEIEAFSSNAIGISLFCLLGAIFIYDETNLRRV